MKNVASTQPRHYKKYVFTGRHKGIHDKRLDSLRHLLPDANSIANSVLARLEKKAASLEALANAMKQSSELQRHAKLKTASRATLVLLLGHLRKNKLLQGKVGVPKIERTVFEEVLRRHVDSEGKQTLAFLCKDAGIGQRTLRTFLNRFRRENKLANGWRPLVPFFGTRKKT